MHILFFGLSIGLLTKNLLLRLSSESRGLLSHVISSLGTLKADLHGTTLTHATSLRQAYDMTWDHLHAYDIFSYKIKYAQVCTGIYGEKALTNVNKYFSCPAL